MNKYLVGGVIAAGLLLVWSWDSARVAQAFADQAGRQADSIAAVNKIKTAKAEADSLTLALLRRESATKSAQIESLRAGYVQKALRASASVRVASDSLHALLVGQEAAQEALRALELGYRTELEAKDSIIAAADASTVVEHNLRLATEAALASDRAARQGGDAEREALRQEVKQLHRTARRDKIAGALIVGGLVYLLAR